MSRCLISILGQIRYRNVLDCLNNYNNCTRFFLSPSNSQGDAPPLPDPRIGTKHVWYCSVACDGSIQTNWRYMFLTSRLRSRRITRDNSINHCTLSYVNTTQSHEELFSKDQFAVKNREPAEDCDSLLRWSFSRNYKLTLEFFLNIFSEFDEFSDKKYLIKVKGFELAT